MSEGYCSCQLLINGDVLQRERVVMSPEFSYQCPNVY